MFFQRESRLQIAGPSGALEVRVSGLQPEQRVKGVAVICHPHPVQGGTLDNKVVFTLARAFRDSGVVAVRFNFRGVGRSEGKYDGGTGELEDLLCIWQWALTAAEQACGEKLPMFLAGFSFGGAVALAALQQGRLAATEVNALVLVAPALGHYGSNANQGLACASLLIQGEDDGIVAATEIQAWAERVAENSAVPGSVVFKQFPDAGHFFHGCLPALKNTVEAYLGDRI